MKYFFFLFVGLYAVVAQAGQFSIEAQTGYGGISTPTVSAIPPNTSDAPSQTATQASSNVTNNNQYGFSWRTALAYLWDNQQMRYGIEAGYNGYPNDSYSSYTIVDDTTVVDQRINYQSYLVDILAVGKYYWAPQWNLYGKIGAALTDQTFTETLNNNVAIKTHFGTLPETELGIGYDVLPYLGLDLSLRYALGDNPNLTSVTTQNYTLNNPTSIPAVLILANNTRIPSIFSVMLGLRYSF